MREEIQIDVKTQYDAVDELSKRLKSLQEQFKGLTKVKIDQGLKKAFLNAENTAEAISKTFDKIESKIKKVEDKKLDAIIVGDEKRIEKSTKELEDWNKRMQVAIKTANSVSVQKKLASDKSGLGDAIKEEQRSSFAQASLQSFMLSLDKPKKKIYELQAAMAQAKQSYIEAFTNFNDKGIKNAAKQIKLINKQLQDAEKKASKGGLSKLLSRFLSVAVWRSIRFILNSIFNTIVSGFQRVVSLNQQASELSVQLRANYNLIATAVGSIAYTFLNSLMGSITSVTNVFIDFANSFNKVLAVFLGADSYLKVVREDVDGISESLGLLSFDKFESLQQSSDTVGVSIEEVAITDDIEEGYTELEKTIKGVLETIVPIIEDIVEIGGTIYTDIIKPIMNTGIISLLINIIAKIISLLNQTGLLKTVLVALIALKVSSWLNSIVKGFNSVTGTITIFITVFTAVYSLLEGLDPVARIVVGALLLIVGGIVAVYTAIQIAYHSWSGFAAIAIGVAAGAAALAGVVGIISGATSLADGYAEGGIPEKSELFYMNEYGVPEALINTGGSETNVINQQQLKTLVRDGFLEAQTLTGSPEVNVTISGDDINNSAFARAIFPALKVESKRRGGSQL